MANCTVKSVTAENGKPSILYEDLLRVTGDQARALRIYTEMANTAFPANDLDQNREPTIEAVEETGILEAHEEARLSKGPQGYNQESIETDVIDAVAQQIEFGIKELQRRLNRDLEEGEREFLENQIEELQDERGAILERETVSAVREAAERQLDWADRLSNKDSASVDQIMDAIKLMDMWKYDNTSTFLTSNQMKSEEDPFNSLFRDASSRAENIQKKLVKSGMRRVVDLVNKYGDGYVEIDDVKELEEFEDIGTATQWLFNISHVSDDLIGHFHRTLTNAKTNQGNEITDLKQRLDRLSEDVEIETLLREDEDGNKVAELIGPFSNEYYGERSEIKGRYQQAKQRARDLGPEQADEEITEAKKDLYSSLNDIETLIDARVFSDEIESEMTESEYRDQLAEQYGEDYADYAIEKGKNLWLQYEQRREDYRNHLIAEVEANTNETLEGESDSQWIDRKIREFRMENSPALYARDREDPSELEFSQNTGWEYTFSLPKANEGYFNDRFENLSDQEMQLWREITSSIQEALSFLPPNVRRNMDETFLPKVQKSTMEMMDDYGMMEAIRYSMKSGIENITDAEDKSLIEDEGKRVPNPFETPGGSPPIRFLNHPSSDRKKKLKRRRLLDKFKNGNITKKVYKSKLSDITEVSKETGVSDRFIEMEKNRFDPLSEEEYKRKLDNLVNDISKDPIKATQMFYAMALNYKMMTDVSAEAKMIHRIVDEANTVEGDKISEGSPAKLKDSIEEEMEFLIAGDWREQRGKSDLFDMIPQDEPNPFKASKRAWRIRNEKKRLENERDKLEDKLRDGEITRAKYDEKLEELDQEYKDLGGSSLVWSSLVDNTLLQFAQLKGMAINPGASFRNLMYGFVANFVHAAGGRDFQDEHVLSATNIVFRELATRGNKVQNLINRFDILFETAEVRHGKDRDMTGGKDVYYLQNKTEHLAQGMTMVAKMLNTEIEDAQGNTGNLYQAFDENGRWKEDEFGKREDWQPDPSRDKGRKFSNFKNEVDQLNKRLHGDYSNFSKQKIKKYTIGRLLSMFRTWIPEVFAYRFGGRRKDPHLGREVVGSYRGTAQALKDNPMGTTLGFLKSLTPFAGQDIEVEGIDQERREAIARTGREMQIWTALTAAVLALQPPEDEDREISASRKVLLNNLIMLNQDVGLYISPTRQVELFKNPMPATRTIVDFDRALKDTYQFLLDDEYQGKHPIRSWAGTMPILKQSETIRWQSERVLSP